MIYTQDTEQFSKYSRIFHSDPLKASELYINMRLYGRDDNLGEFDQESIKQIVEYTSSRLEKIAKDPKLYGSKISARAFIKEVREALPEEFNKFSN